MNRKNAVVCLLSILLLAGVLRFLGLAHRGLFYADETRYYRYSAAAREGMNAYVAGSADKTIKGFLAALLPLVEGFAGKPGHQILGLAGLYIFGMHQYSVLFVSALLGIAMVFLVFLIGRFYDVKTGILSALILSVCPAHILFSRSFLAHSNQAFFLVLAVYLYLMGLRTRSKRRIICFLSALCLGYSFLVHPTGLIYFAPFMFCELFLWLRRKRGFIDILGFFVFFLMPFFIIEAMFIFGRNEFGSLAAGLNKSYIGQIFFVNREAASLGIETNKNLGPFHYIIMSWLTNGAIFTILLALSLVFYLGYVFRKRDMPNFIIGLVPIGLFFYWQFISVHERLFREIIVLFPFFCIIIAIFVSRLHKKAIAFLVFVLMAEGLWYSAGILLSVRSDYPKLERFLEENRIDKIITPSEYLATTSDVLMPHLKGLKVYLVSDINEAKGLMRREGLRYAMVSGSNWLGKEEFRFKTPALMRVPDPDLVYFPSFYESTKTTNRIEYLKYKNNPDAVCVGIYDLEKERL